MWGKRGLFHPWLVRWWFAPDLDLLLEQDAVEEECLELEEEENRIIMLLQSKLFHPKPKRMQYDVALFLPLVDWYLRGLDCLGVVLVNGL